MVAGVKLLLSQESGLELHMLCADIEALLERTLTVLRPDVVIMDEKVRAALPAQLWRWVTRLPDLCVINFSQTDNVLTIYQHERASETHARNLRRIIRRRGSGSSSTKWAKDAPDRE